MRFKLILLRDYCVYCGRYDHNWRQCRLRRVLL